MIYNSKFNTIGVVASVFIGVLIAVVDSWSCTYYISIFVLIIPFVIALINLMYRKVNIPWLDKKQMLDKMQVGRSEYFEALINDVFEVTETLRVYKKFAQVGVSISIWSIFISIVLASSFAVCQLLQSILQ